MNKTKNRKKRQDKNIKENTRKKKHNTTVTTQQNKTKCYL